MTDLITTAQAAHIANIRPNTLRQLAANPNTKTPPPQPIRIDGRTILWNRQAIETWAANRDRNPGKEPTT